MRAAAILVIVAGLAWGLLMGAAAFGCALGGSWLKGISAAAAAVPAAACIALCAFGVALWRRSPWVLVLAPAPLCLGMALFIASLVEPRAFRFAACVISLEGIGPWAPWMAPSLIPSFGTAILVFLIFAVVIPGVGLALLARLDRDAFVRVRELLPSRRALRWVATIATAACLAAPVVQRLRPLPLDASFATSSKSLPATDQLPQPGLIDRLQIVNVKLSTVGRGALLPLVSLLEQRLGPIKWASHQTDTNTRYVTATGHFPPSVWRPRYEARALEFDSCLDALRGNRRDNRYIQDWSDWWHGRLTTGEVSGRWGSQVDVSELPGNAETVAEAATTPAQALRGPGAELYAGLVRCAQQVPHMSEEEFSRVVLQWRCVWLRCRWVYIDPAAWSRVSPLPCRDAGPGQCTTEAFDYLATGELARVR